MEKSVWQSLRLNEALVLYDSLGSGGSRHFEEVINDSRGVMCGVVKEGVGWLTQTDPGRGLSRPTAYRLHRA